MLQTIEDLDRKLFLLLNGLHNAQLDKVMFWMSDTLFWVPFYLVLGGLAIYFYRKQSWLIFLCAGLLITATDQFSGLIKNSVKRYRPCHNLEIANLVHVVGGCGGQYGFFSSHATNTFALATFLTLLLSKKYEYFGYFLFAWAFLVSYSRIYVGAHYPVDVAAGAFTGMLFGFLSWRLFRLGQTKIYPEFRTV